MAVLVAYGSRHGGTAEIGRFLADRLRERGVDAEVRPIGEVTELAGRDAFVLGSAVYAGSWLKDASAFVRTHRETLSHIPVWLFSSGPIGEGGEHGVSDSQLAELEDALHPREHRVFGGTLDKSELGFLERKIVKMVKAPEGDFRDWDAIGAFADEIAAALSSKRAPAA
jgi:menaquinone-dependent protoporphyrinogen oxidase